MKKRLLLLFAALLTFWKTAFAFDFSVEAPTGQTLYYNINEDGISVSVTFPPSSSYPMPTGELIIPDNVTYDGTSYVVTSIGLYAFNDCRDLTSVTIPNSVTSIGRQAFDNCYNLTSVTIPNSVTSIGQSAFDDCRSLTSMTIPNSVTSIGSNAFHYCDGLTSVDFLGTVSQWCKITFGGPSANPTYYSHGLSFEGTVTTNLIIPNDVTEIKPFVFYGCSDLTSVTIPNTVISIGQSAFDGCTQIMNINMLGAIPPTVQPNSFNNVPSIANLHVPCDAVSTYQNASAVWNQFNIVEKFPYSFSATTSDQARGTVQVIHAPECSNREAEILATPYHNFHFVRWSDGNTEAHRYIVVLQDTALQAEFGDGGVGIEDVADGSDINISVTNGRIHVNIDGKPIEEFDVYNVMGCRVAHVIHSEYSPVLPMGVYLIKIGNLPARKVVVVR